MILIQQDQCRIAEKSYFWKNPGNPFAHHFGLNKPESRMYVRNFPITGRGFDFVPRG
jgi:hypothetical protein